VECDGINGLVSGRTLWYLVLKWAAKRSSGVPVLHQKGHGVRVDEIQRRRQSTGTRGAMGSFFLGGAHGERVEREPITGVWGRSPQRGPGAEPMVRGSGGQSPLKLKAFSSRTCNGQGKFVPFAVFSAVHYNKIERCKIRAGTSQ